MNVAFHNFRDLTSLNLNCGKKLNRQLLRSGSFDKLNKEYVESLFLDYKIKTVIDLRAQREIEGSPFESNQTINYYNFDISKEMVDNHSNNYFSSENLLADTERNIEFYKFLATNFYAQKMMKQCLNIIINNDEGAVVVNCAVGKDRTGILIALILKLIGVPYEYIEKDYLQSNYTLRKINFIKAQMLKKQYEEHLPHDFNYLNLFKVKPIYLQSFFGEIQAAYGSFESFYKNTLKIDSQELAVLRGQYTF
jgi:protein-tyrosine phosphatase